MCSRGSWHSADGGGVSGTGSAAAGAAVSMPAVTTPASTATIDRTALFSHRAGTKFSLFESIAPTDDRLRPCVHWV